MLMQVLAVQLVGKAVLLVWNSLSQVMKWDFYFPWKKQKQTKKTPTNKTKPNFIILEEFCNY